MPRRLPEALQPSQGSPHHRTRSRVPVDLVLLTLVTALFACAEVPDTAAESASIEACRPEGMEEDLRCGVLTVPEDRSRPDGRRLRIAFTVIPATGEALEPPLYHLVGGPGNGAGPWPALYTGSAPWPTAQELPRLRRDRDIVLVDHRGAGGSGALHCPTLDAFHRLRPTFPLDEVRSCRDGLSAGADLSHYHAEAAARDLDAVRRALGHDQIDLRGSSYGTHLALATMRLFPDVVRRVVLLGTLPLNNRVPLEHARHGEAILQRLLTECAEDEACAAAFPDLEPRWRSLLADLEAEPLVVQWQTVDGGVEPLTIGRGNLVEAVRSLLPAFTTQRRIPAILHSFLEGNREALLQRVLGNEGDTFAMGLYLSAQCPHTLRAQGSVAEATAGTMLGDFRIAAQLAACREWPRARLPADWFEPVRSTAPTLLITGDRDHETPVHWGDQVAGNLTHARHVVVPFMGHVSYDLEDPSCLPRVIDAFLRAAEPLTVDVACLEANGDVPFQLAPDA